MLFCCYLKELDYSIYTLFKEGHIFKVCKKPTPDTDMHEMEFLNKKGEVIGGFCTTIDVLERAVESGILISIKIPSFNKRKINL